MTGLYFEEDENNIKKEKIKNKIKRKIIKYSSLFLYPYYHKIDKNSRLVFYQNI